LYALNYGDYPPDKSLYPLASNAIYPVYMPNYNSIFITTNQVHINIPFDKSSLEYSAIVAIINMIRLKGTTYKLITL
jgi:hypothetical protein